MNINCFPIAVAIAVIIKNGKILLIQRIKDGYEGCWGLPGGKVKVREHVSETAVREVLEETGLQTEFVSHLGFVSEHQIDGKQIKHLTLHLCELSANQVDVVKQPGEGELDWFDLDGLHLIRDKMIPSDYLMIEKMVKVRQGGYYNCVIETIEGRHILKKFE
jgi:ADP-ribose pyrophosphatase YjhB (NUDIX family)